jgi:hypothetical protein
MDIPRTAPDDSSLRWLEACTCLPAPKGLPSSLVIPFEGINWTAATVTGRPRTGQLWCCTPSHFDGAAIRTNVPATTDIEIAAPVSSLSSPNVTPSGLA